MIVLGALKTCLENVLLFATARRKLEGQEIECYGFHETNTFNTAYPAGWSLANLNMQKKLQDE